MQYLKKIRLILIAVLFLHFFCRVSVDAQVFSYPNLIDVKFVPESKDSEPIYWASNGALFGFALPTEQDEDMYGAFIGPYSISAQKWLSKSMLKFSISDGKRIEFKDANHKTIMQYPGLLYQKYDFDNFIVEQRLVFISGRSVLVKNDVINTADSTISLALRIDGMPFKELGIGSSFANGYRFEISDRGRTDLFLLLRFKSNLDVSLGVHTDYYEYAHIDLHELESRDTLSMSLTLSQYFFKDPSLDTELTSAALSFPNTYFDRNQKLWDSYLSAIPSNLFGIYKTILVKSLQEFIMCLRTPSKLMPNYHFVSGEIENSEFIVTDHSCLFTAAMTKLDPTPAYQHFISILRFQESSGAVPDTIFTSRHAGFQENHHNKYPMLCWTAFNLFNITEDYDFAINYLPFLESYIGFWNSKIDENNNAWIENEKGEECPVINALLFSEYFALSKLCEIINENEKSEFYKTKYDQIRLEFNIHFFDDNLKNYVSINSQNGKKQISYDAGMIALWTGLAGREIAISLSEYYRNILTDPEKIQKFRESEKDPVKMWFLVSGLNNYGLTQLADAYKHEFIFSLLDDDFAKQTGRFKNVLKPQYQRADFYAVILLLLYT
jgi:hypothetical protein